MAAREGLVSYKLVFRRYAPFDTFGGGFEGDIRTKASTDIKASARTVGVVAFDTAGVANVAASSSGTSFKGLGAWVERHVGRANSKVHCSVNVATNSGTTLTFTAQTAGANPLVPKAPNIVTIVQLSITFSPTAMTFLGDVRGDDFPNAEVIAYDARDRGILLYAFSTSGGQTSGPFTRLPSMPRGHDNKKIGAFFKRIPIDRSGSFMNAH